MKLERASLDHHLAMVEFAQSCLSDGLKRYQLAVTEPRVYLSRLMANTCSNSQFLKPNQSAYATYFALEAGEILGAIRIRLGSSERIKSVFGHLGYETKPTCRNKGVAKFMLRSIKNKYRHQCSLLVSCSIDNRASQKVIEACGGEKLRSVNDPKYGHLYRYQLT